MAQFDCDICGAGFEQKSAYERHMQTSHPKQAVSAADIEKALKGIDFPKQRDELVEAVTADDQQEVREIIQQLPDQQYRDAAEVSRAFGELRTHEKAPDSQPSKTGGKRAMEAPSAARFASLFSGMDFPADASQLREHARSEATEDEMQTLKKFSDKTYNTMADVAKELGRVR